jgi:hypothetical protein
LYLDGGLIANGTGVVYYPSPTQSAAGFRIGSDQNGNNQADGVFDELQTFNYPLSAASIQQSFQNAWDLDSSGDGLPNILKNELGLNPYGYYSPNGLSGTNGLQVFTPLK